MRKNRVKNSRKINKYLNQLIDELNSTIHNNFDVEIWYSNNYILLFLLHSEFITHSDINWFEKSDEEIINIVNSNDDIFVDEVYTYILKENKRKNFSKKAMYEDYKYIIYKTIYNNEPQNYMVESLINPN